MCVCLQSRALSICASTNPMHNFYFTCSLCLSLQHICTHIHAHVLTHTHTHTHQHTRQHTHTHANIHTPTHTYTPVQAPSQQHHQTETYTHTPTHAHTPALDPVGSTQLPFWLTSALSRPNMPFTRSNIFLPFCSCTHAPCARYVSACKWV